MNLFANLLAVAVLPIIIAQVSNKPSYADDSIPIGQFFLDHSWVASIQLNGQHKCAGSILSERIILTAASCTVGHQPRNLTVLVGNSRYIYGDAKHRVINMINHKGYQNSSVDDLALLKVSPSIYLSGTHVNKIDIAGRRYVPAPNEGLSITGWKRIEHTGSKELRDFKVHIIKQCKEKISEGQICTGPFTMNGEICEDDVGSPLVVNNILVGVKSSGLPCDSSISPGIYSNVSHYYDWIKQNSVALDKMWIDSDEISSIHNHPWFASIEADNRTICTGSIISEKIILTTSSCFDNNSPSESIVRVGDSRRGHGGSFHRIDQIVKHDDINKSTSNLALLKVSPDFKFGWNVNMIKLARRNDVVAPNATVSYPGWAYTDTLMDINLRTVDCKLKNESTTQNGQLCLMHKSLRHRACRSSAGGPLVANNTQVAIVILDYSCYHVKFQGIYSNVAYYRDWIDQNIEKLKSIPVGEEEISTIDKHPWLASIQVYGKPACIGSIISKSVVLTAAQCVSSAWMSNVTVRVGNHGLNLGGSLHEVIYINSYGNRMYDVTLLKVSPAFEFSSNVKMITLAKRNNVVAPNTSVNYAEWTSDTKLVNSSLRIVKCESMNNLTTSYEQICIAPVQLTQRLCHISSGSPLIDNGVQVAVMVFDRHCSQVLVRGVYSNVSYYRDWIDQNVEILESSPVEVNKISTIDKHPWLVTIENIGLPYCSGSIISKRIILTSVHCVEFESISSITVKVGDFGSNSESLLYNVVDVMKYGDSDPGYIKSMFDVALLKVSTEFKFGKDVNKIDLASVVAPDTNANYASWTADYELMSTNLHIMNCRSIRNVTNSIGQICAAPIILSRKTCHNRGGSALVANNVQVGVVINRSKCHQSIPQEVHSNVSYYRNWIDQSVKTLDSIPDGMDKISTIEKHPWLATIQFYNEPVCTGSIISERIVLTAAHCLRKITPYNRTVRVGNSGHNYGGSVHNIIDVQEQEIDNPQSNDESINVGLVLLKVSPDFKLGSSVKKINLARKSDVVAPNTDVSYAGWTSNNELMDTKLHIVKCKDINNLKISNDEFCVAPITLSRRSCKTSSGSPLVANNVQVAVLVYGRNCNLHRAAGVYINVSHYLNWIEENLKILNSRPVDKTSS